MSYLTTLAHFFKQNANVVRQLGSRHLNYNINPLISQSQHIAHANKGELQVLNRVKLN